jgi:hypothetical protein
MKRLEMLAAALAALLLSATAPARAVDGCKVLLCLAGNWQAIGECVPPVEQALADMALGAPFPSCSFASAPSFAAPSAASPIRASNVAIPQFSVNSTSCPPQGTSVFRWGSMTLYRCAYQGAIPLYVNGQLWSTTYWNSSGGYLTVPTAAIRPAMAAVP